MLTDAANYRPSTSRWWVLFAAPSVEKTHCPQISGRSPGQFLEGSLKRSQWCSNPGLEITGTIHRLQLPAAQKDHARTKTAAISNPTPDLRWVHRVKHPGC